MPVKSVEPLQDSCGQESVSAVHRDALRKVVSVPQADIDPIWFEYKETPTEALKTKIIEKYMPLVKRVAGKMYRTLPPHVDLDDITQFGSLGLMRAVNNYDPTVGVNFETFAAASIRGLILDELRSLDWAPRSLRRRQREINKASSELESVFERAPTREEIAVHLSLTPAEVVATQQATEAAKTKSLDESVEDGSDTWSKYESVEDSSQVDPETVRHSKMVHSSISGFVRSLPLQEQLVVCLYYYEGLTLAEVGRVCGIPESRASQIHTKIMVEVRSQLLELMSPA